MEPSIRRRRYTFTEWKAAIAAVGTCLIQWFGMDDSTKCIPIMFIRHSALKENHK